MGATGSMMARHAFCTSTSRMALRLIFLKLELAPRVATSLDMCQLRIHRPKTLLETYQTVAMPYLREVSTVSVSMGLHGAAGGDVTFVAVEHRQRYTMKRIKANAMQRTGRTVMARRGWKKDGLRGVRLEARGRSSCGAKLGATVSFALTSTRHAVHDRENSGPHAQVKRCSGGWLC